MPGAAAWSTVPVKAILPPVIEEPEYLPVFPPIVVGAVLVTAEPPGMAKFSPEPRIELANAEGGLRNVAANATVRTTRAARLGILLVMKSPSKVRSSGSVDRILGIGRGY
jgi:hypothetical protein